MKLKHIILLIAVSSVWCAARARTISLDSFLDSVMSRNVALAAERLNIPIAEAQARATAVFNDPTLGMEYAYNDDRRMQMGQSIAVELGYTVSPGKRGARRNLAESEKDLAAALFDDYLSRLRLEAAVAYHEAVKADALARLADGFSSSMAAVAGADSLGLVLGQVREVDAMSTRIEARLARSEADAALTDRAGAVLALASMMGDPALARSISPEQPSEGLLRSYPDIDENAAVTEALLNRADLRAAMRNVEVAERALKVEQKERNMDFDLAIGYNYNTEVRNEIAPAPRFSGVTVGLSIPLRFSNSNRGAVTAARMRREQAELQYRQAEIEVQAQVISAIDAYRRARATMAMIDSGTLGDSRTIYNSYLEAYRFGDVSLIELLEVRNSYRDLLRLHAEAVCNLATARARLMAAIGR